PKGVENLQHKGGIDIGHDTIRFRRRRIGQMLGKVNGERRHPWPAGGLTAGQRNRPCPFEGEDRRSCGSGGCDENGAAIIHQINAWDFLGAGGVKSRHL
ncbi:MAG: hypothetical protein ACJA1L_002875, partial [Paracoccaceae bacterium]